MLYLPRPDDRGGRGGGCSDFPGEDCATGSGLQVSAAMWVAELGLALSRVDSEHVELLCSLTMVIANLVISKTGAREINVTGRTYGRL